MSSISPVLSSTPNEVSCVFIPMVDRPLLLPNAAVVEVVSLTDLDRSRAHEDWLLGYVKWRELDMPVISFEAMKGEEAADTENGYVAIINSVLGRIPFFGIQAQGVPRVARVFSDEVHEEPVPVTDVESMQVVVSSDLAVIPKLELIESRLAALGQALA